MKLWRFIFPLILFLSLIFLFVLYPTDEKRIRNILNYSEKAIVSEDVEKLMEFVSYNYRDDHGNGYIQIKKIMQTAFKRLNDIEIERNIIKLSVEEDYAEAELSVRVSASEGEERGYIIGDIEKTKTIRVFFEKLPHKWLITKVDGVF